MAGLIWVNNCVRCRIRQDKDPLKTDPKSAFYHLDCIRSNKIYSNYTNVICIFYWHYRLLMCPANNIRIRTTITTKLQSQLSKHYTKSVASLANFLFFFFSFFFPPNTFLILKIMHDHVWTKNFNDARSFWRDLSGQGAGGNVRLWLRFILKKCSNSVS